MTARRGPRSGRLHLPTLAAAGLALLLLTRCDREVPAPTPLPARGDAGTPRLALPEPEPRRESLPAMVLNFEGTAEVQRAGTTGWVALKIGDAIRAGDAVRTAAGGRLEFALGEAQLRVQSGSEVLLQGFDPSSIRVEVRGHIEAEMGGAGRTLELSPPGGGPPTSLEAGRVAFAADPSGGTSLAAVAGAVRASFGGERVELGPGEFTTTARGKPASPPRKLPSRVVLRVAWPVRPETNRPQLSLRGKTSALTAVRVQGHRVEPGPDGTFNTEVKLRRGPQRVVVEARDVLGRTVQDARTLTFDPDAPSIKGEVEYR